MTREMKGLEPAGVIPTTGEVKGYGEENLDGLVHDQPS
jgi:hypothetical protein